MLKRFTGTIMQVPPMYSAVKHQGKPMYAYAREGLEIERQPREAIIHDLHIEAIRGNELRILVKCGSGTYIRTLAEDIGKALGCGGAYLTACAVAFPDFDLSQAYTLDALEAMPLPQRDCCLLPTDILLHIKYFQSRLSLKSWNVVARTSCRPRRPPSTAPLRLLPTYPGLPTLVASGTSTSRPFFTS